MAERLPKLDRVKVMGEADVLQLFPASKKTAAGLRVPLKRPSTFASSVAARLFIREKSRA